MYSRGSRYRQVPTSVHLTASGERTLSTELRAIPSRSGRFVHTVRERERIDLLAYRYYSDPTRWWQIADANPGQPFPLDLVDRRPYVEEDLPIARASHEQALALLIQDLAAIGPTVRGASDLMSATLTVRHGGARATAVAAVGARGFRLLSSFGFDDGGPVEELVIEDPASKLAWAQLLASVTQLPGLRTVVPMERNAGLRLDYNQAMLTREALLAEISRHGFSPLAGSAQRKERVGAGILIPADQVT
jgi:hypothetical protein